MKKISLTGPECSGKTTLCRELATHFHCLWVPEMARLIQEKEGPHYTAEKVEAMARLQLEEEQRLEQLSVKAGHPWLFCDTDLLVYQIWMEERFGFCPDWIRQQVSQAGYFHTLLLKPDIPWMHDPLRENPHNRDLLFERYKIALNAGSIAWTEISGTNRIADAIRILSQMPF